MDYRNGNYKCARFTVNLVSDNKIVLLYTIISSLVLICDNVNM